MQGELQIYTLGGLRLMRAGNALGTVTSRKAQALLVYLAAAARPVAREVLADLLWDERPQQQAMANLRGEAHRLRSVLGSELIGQRRTLAVDVDATWLDSHLLENACRSLPGAGETLSRDTAEVLARAVLLYEGEFLSGFDAGPAAGFAEWLELERERLRQCVADALQALVEYHLADGSFQQGLVQARRLLQLDPLLEVAHLQLMRLLASSGQRAAALAQFDSYRDLLAGELGLEPSEEARLLLEEIRAGPISASPSASSRPTFTAVEASRPSTFVGRERELAWLEQHLVAALEGSGRTVFLSGEAGSGKTSLLARIARRAAEKRSDLLIAIGKGRAFAGVGDPYLPFRQLFEMLSGDVEPGLHGGFLDIETARGIWDGRQEFLAKVSQLGPDLIDILIPSAAIARRSGAGDYRPLLTSLPPGSPRVAAGLHQAQIFEQSSLVLRSVAARRPLLVILDDMQWFDVASLGLLFNLAGKLTDRPLLLAGAFRPSQVAVADDRGEPHPLRALVTELTRQWGEIVLDMEHFDANEARRFVDALCDLEPGILDGSLREGIYQRTRGHPLFTKELLRTMKERGTLAQDSSGRWNAALGLDGGRLPARIEAVLDSRLERLTEEERDLLAAAAVEGEEFTGQVVANVLGTNVRDTLRHLGQVLGGRHQLVRFAGEQRAGTKVVSRYRFSHVLFQQRLYSGLDPSERRLLHSRVAGALEALHAPELEELAVQLAHHYHEGGDAARAALFRRRAGDRARRLAALHQAVDNYRWAVAHWPVGNGREPADIRLALADCLLTLGEYPEATRALEEALPVFEAAGDIQGAGAVERLLGRIYWEQSERSLAMHHYQRALAILERGPEEIQLAHLISSMSQMHMLASDYDEAIRLGKRSLSLARKLGAPDVTVHAINNLGASFQSVGKPKRGNMLLRASLCRALELGRPHDACRAYANIGDGLELYECRYDEARELFEEMLAYTRKLDAEMFRLVALTQLTRIEWRMGRWAGLLDRCAELEEALSEAAPSIPSVWASTALGSIYVSLGRHELALERLESRLTLSRTADELQTTVPHQGQMAAALALSGKHEEAETMITEYLERIDGRDFYHPGSLLPLLFACNWSLERPAGADLVRARECSEHLERLKDQLGSPDSMAAASEARGHVAFAEGDAVSSVRAFEDAASGWGQIGLPLDEARALRSLAKALRASEDARAPEVAARVATLLGRVKGQVGTVVWASGHAP